MATTPQAVEVAETSWLQANRGRLSLFGISAVMGISIIVLAIYPLLAFRWLQNPFLGAFIEQTLLFNDSGPSQTGTWSAASLGLGFGDELLAIEGQTINSVDELNNLLADHSPGKEIQLSVKLNSGERTEFLIELQQFPSIDILAYFIVPFAMGLVYWLTGLWVLRFRSDEPAGQIFALFASAAAISMAGIFDLYTTHVFTRLWTMAMALAAGALLTLGLIFPKGLKRLVHLPSMQWIGIYAGVILGVAAQFQLFNRNQPAAYAFWWRLEYIFAIFSIVAFLGLIAFRRVQTDSPIIREQVRIILIGAGVGLAPLTVWLILTLAQPLFTFQPLWLLPPMILFPISIAYAILRYRLFNVDYLLSQAMVYGLLGFFVALGYGLLVLGTSYIAGTVLNPTQPFLIAILVFVLTIAFNPTRNTLQRRIDFLFFRGSYAYRERQQLFSRQLTQAIDIPSITLRLRQHIEESLHPTHLHIFILDSVTMMYQPMEDRRGATTDLRFGTTSALAIYLQEMQTSLYLAPIDPLPPPLLRDRARLAVLRSIVFVPLSAQGELAGWLALGPKSSGEPYRREDLAFLESLADQSSLAIVRAQVVVDLEHRVNELNVLSRVSQAINFTQSYDDLLELTYAQSNHVIPTREFRIALFDERDADLKYEFLLSNNERLFETEGRALRIDEGLLRIVSENGAPMLTNEYLEECAQIGVKPEDNYRAWLGVPLNAGTSTLGAIGIGTFDPGQSYSDEQLKIMAAIADQAAGAIVKARLYRQSEERARQLGTLNQVASTIASTLEFEPLLQRILTSAVELLDCEAGNLVLVDERTGDLVFRVTAGPVADEFAGRRLPPGTGLIGDSIDRGVPVVINNAPEDPRWSDENEGRTGFQTQALIILPLTIKDRVIGAVEVVNKNSGGPFDDDDQALLAAFAAQAAVAIDNARLYTLTDQALAERVEELSVMQRIDRELNVSLDLRRSLQITLSWAMRYTDADAGLIAILVNDKDLRVMVYENYPAGFEPEKEQPLPPELGGLEQVIRDRKALLLADITEQTDYTGLHPTGRSFMTAPLIRENRAMGAILLESTRRDYFDEARSGFVTRLVDHGSIAIANAQLYSEVQDANLAKSEFVSFVSHELKTPMTSIKGYADLLAQGNVGPITDSQANFLATIRANVDRMSSLVSDLTDVSRIETGRMRLDFEAVQIEELLEEVIRSAQEQIDGKQQTLSLDLPDNLPAAWGDRTRIIQVLANLISNANKYTPDGGRVTVRIKVDGGEPALAKAAEWLHIAVKDTGIGIDAREQEQIFQKFFRSEDRAVHESPGTGLGLNISKFLVELQGGQIWFESEYGDGSTFHFTIPIADAVEPAAQDADRAPEGASD